MGIVGGSDPPDRAHPAPGISMLYRPSLEPPSVNDRKRGRSRSGPPGGDQQIR